MSYVGGSLMASVDELSARALPDSYWSEREGRYVHGVRAEAERFYADAVYRESLPWSEPVDVLSCPMCGRPDCKVSESFLQATRSEPMRSLGFFGYCPVCACSFRVCDRTAS